MREATDPARSDATLEVQKEIIKLLQKAVDYSGQRAPQVFRDWLALVEGSLTSQNALADSIRRINELYYRPERCLPPMMEAQTALLSSTQRGYHDTIGAVFAAFAHPNVALGQIFTPDDVAHLMATLLNPDGDKEIERLREKAIAEAGKRDPVAGAIIQAGGWTMTLARLMQSPDSERWAHTFFWEKLLPAITPYVEPLTVYDPAVGSGVMHLAAAARFPDWAVRMGWVQFSGADIDPDCVRMCRINHRLYGFSARVIDGLTASEAELKTLDPVTEQFYRRARDARRRGDKQLVQYYIEESRRAKAQRVAQQIALVSVLGQHQKERTQKK